MKSWLSYLSPNAGNPKSKIWVGHKMHTSGPTQVPALNKLLFDSASQCLVSETSYHEVAIRPRSPALVHRIYFFFFITVYLDFPYFTSTPVSYYSSL